MLADSCLFAGNLEGKECEGFRAQRIDKCGVLEKLKDDACLWVTAGAKYLKRLLQHFLVFALIQFFMCDVLFLFLACLDFVAAVAVANLFISV